MLENLTYFLNGASLSFFAMGAFHMAIYARQGNQPHYLFTICLIWMALIELKSFPEPRAAYNYEILGPGFTFPDLFTLALLSLFFFELVMPGRIGTIQPQTAEPLRSARRRLLARNGFRTPHGICFPAGVAKGPAVLPADGTSALHPIHRRLLPLRPDSHRPLLHPLLPGDRPGPTRSRSASHCNGCGGCRHCWPSTCFHTSSSFYFSAISGSPFSSIS